jgi:hypothetical protein
MLPRRNHPFLALSLLALPFLHLACQGEGAGLLQEPNSMGISYSDPEVGDQETYVRFTYGDLHQRDTAKTYTQGRMTLKVLAVGDKELLLEETRCYEWDSACQVQEVKLDRMTGQVEAPGPQGWSVLMDANAFPSGIFSENPGRTIPFEGYSPSAQEPVVGIAANFRTASGTYGKVTVMANPTDIPVDGGGKCLVLTPKDRLIEIRYYQVFGIDGGWEILE